MKPIAEKRLSILEARNPCRGVRVIFHPIIKADGARVECDAFQASDGRTWERSPHESYEDFEARAIDEAERHEGPGAVRLLRLRRGQ